MFESDDFDQILSQYDISEAVSNTPIGNIEKPIQQSHNNDPNLKKDYFVSKNNNTEQIHKKKSQEPLSSKQNKRKMINSLFDHKSKRKFPGPAGLLIGTIEENNENICHIELLSQDVAFTENCVNSDIFESSLWHRLKDDVDKWKSNKTDSLSTIKLQALTGHLRKRKADTITAFVETVDRSATDPLLVLRDTSGNIKCTLHRDAWSVFSSYIVSEQCAIVLCKPTILTTGGAFKKHYLNITMSNIVGIYSSAVLNDDQMQLSQHGYEKEIVEEFTVIRKNPSHSGDNNVSGDISNLNDNFLDDFDSNIFSQDLF